MAVATGCGTKKEVGSQPNLPSVSTEEPTVEETEALTEAEEGLIAEDEEVDVGEMI